MFLRISSLQYKIILVTIWQFNLVWHNSTKKPCFDQITASSFCRSYYFHFCYQNICFVYRVYRVWFVNIVFSKKKNVSSFSNLISSHRKKLPEKWEKRNPLPAMADENGPDALFAVKNIGNNNIGETRLLRVYTTRVPNIWRTLSVYLLLIYC